MLIIIIIIIIHDFIATQVSNKTSGAQTRWLSISRKSALGLVVTVTFDLWLVTFSEILTTWWLFEASSIEITQVQIQVYWTYSRKAKNQEAKKYNKKY